jgi:hypothetical protein
MAVLSLTDVQKLRLYIMDGDLNDTDVPRAFSDDELETILSWKDGDILEAALYCIDRLLMNASKRFNYKQGETQVDFKQVVEQLEQRRADIVGEIESDGSNGGMILAQMDSPYISEGDEQCAIGCDKFDRLQKIIRAE